MKLRAIKIYYVSDIIFPCAASVEYVVVQRAVRVDKRIAETTLTGEPQSRSKQIRARQGTIGVLTK